MTHEESRKRAFQIIEAYRAGKTVTELAAMHEMTKAGIVYAVKTYSRSKYQRYKNEHRQNGPSYRRYTQAREMYELGLAWEVISERMGFASVDSCRRTLQYYAATNGFPTVGSWIRP